MANNINDTINELPLPVNYAFMEKFLRNAKARLPYYMGTMPAELMKKAGTASVKWRRIENLTPTTTALAELTGNATFMNGRDSEQLTVTDITATALKYGQYIITNEEVDLYEPNGTAAKIVEVLGISAGRSLNALQRDVGEDNAVQVQEGGAANDAAQAAALTQPTLEKVALDLDVNAAMPFTPMTTGSTNIGTQPILDAFWAITHPHVGFDIKDFAGFKSVETYAGQVETVPGELGYIPSAGIGLRIVTSQDAGIDAGAGAVAGAGIRNTAGNADLYTTLVYGRDAIGSVGLEMMHDPSMYMAGDDRSTIELISKGLGSSGTADPFNEIATVAWKAFHAGAILNDQWVFAVRSAATDPA